MKTHLLKAAVLGVSILALAGCGKELVYPDQDDRKTVTIQEIDTIQDKVSNMKGVSNFSLSHMEDGIYGELTVENKKDAKDLAIETFNLMRVETSRDAVLFVKLNDKNETILIQAHKPSGKDNENQWDILL